MRTMNLQSVAFCKMVRLDVNEAVRTYVSNWTVRNMTCFTLCSEEEMSRELLQQ